MSKPDKIVSKEEAFEWAIDYKPLEENLLPQQYAEYGYEQGFLAGIKHNENTQQDWRKIAGERWDMLKQIHDITFILQDENISF